jgi:DNA-binding MarR family transcriptional regulator
MPFLEELQATRGCHCLIARKAARSITRLYEAKLRPHGLRATQFSILAVLTLKGPTRLGEVASMLDLERTTLTRVAGLLSQRGLVADEGSEDGRERLLCVTEAGRSTLEAALPAWQEAQQAASEPLRSELAGQGEVSNESGTAADRPCQSSQFVERALRDFGLLDTFESRTPEEREGCLQWIADAAGEREEERRVSRLVDDLLNSRALPIVSTGREAN